ncbi:MAG TPA: hypothetical protein VHS78_08505 [Candidatus Elarobacter sp.]|jgi:hypothetical protein|nr:hypothetical protein [Candidatus Elarobacter sp.]
MFVAFVLRLVGYALLLGVTSRVMQSLWTGYGLDGVRRLQHFHDVTIAALLIAPVVLALLGFGRLQAVAVFCGFFLTGAALTAPFVCVRVAGV